MPEHFLYDWLIIAPNFEKSSGLMFAFVMTV
jgi:hypothetical protein